MRENNWKNKGKKLLATVMLACLLLAVTGGKQQCGGCR